MSITAPVLRGSATNKTAGTTIGVAPGVAIPAGKIAFALVGAHNTSAANGATTTHSGVADGAGGNTWEKLFERTFSTEVAAAGGVTLSLWKCKVATEIGTGHTITATIASTTPKGIAIWEAGVGAGADLVLATTGTPMAHQDSSGASVSVATSGMTSKEYLHLGLVGQQNETLTWTEDADYTNIFTTVEGISTGPAGTAATNVVMWAGYRIATLTGDTFAPTLPTASDRTATLIALEETSGAPALSGGATSTVTTVATGAGQKDTSGGATSTVAHTPTGAGSKGSSGGATSTVTAPATGAGTKGAEGGSTSTVATVATGDGIAEGGTPSGGATSSVSVVATGAGVKAASGGSTSTVIVVATGGGATAKSGGATSAVNVVASGAGTPAKSGGATSIVTVVATGGTFGPRVLDVGQPLQWLGGKIDVRVEVDTGLDEAFGGLWDVGQWATDEWGSIDPLYQDITPYVHAVKIDRGKARWDERFQVGGLTVTLDNTSGIFTPNPPVPVPWVIPWRPGRRIRVVTIPDLTTGEKVPLFTGVIDTPNVVFTEAGYDVIAIVHALDYMASWSANNPPATVATGTQLTSERVEAALDYAEWPVEDRLISAGKHTMETSELAQTTLEEVQRAADSEGGAFYCDAAGRAVFRHRDWLAEDTRSVVVQGYLGYDPADVPEDAQIAHVLDVQTSWELNRVRNDIQFARVGGTLQRVTDAASKVAYGGMWRSYQRTDFHNISDSQVRLLALRYLDVFKVDRLRIEEVQLAANDDPDDLDLNRLFWQTDFGDLLQVLIPTTHGWEVEASVHVVGIKHEITPDDWLVTLTVDDSATFIPELTYWELGVIDRSELGNSTILAP